MRKRNIDIPILGIDRRPSYRQEYPGLCSEILNLEPTGPKETPYWKGIPKSKELVNDVGQVFSVADQDKIVDAAWHQRSKVGNYKNSESDSLRRLVCFFSDGFVRVFDPGVGDNGWGMVVEKKMAEAFDSEGVEFEAFLEGLIFSVEDGSGIGRFHILIDDMILPFKIPELPVIKHELVKEGDYSQEQLDNDLYNGLRRGIYYLMYAFELNDGTFIKHSEITTIRSIGVLSDGEFSTNQLDFHFEGYKQTGEPENLDFWNDQIRGVSIFLSDRRYTGIGYSDPTATHNDGYDNYRRIFSREEYESLQLYKIGSFDFLKVDDDREVNTDLTFSGADGTLTTKQLLNVDNFSHHQLLANTFDVYNSRLLLGGSGVDFATPSINARQQQFIRIGFDAYRTQQIRVHIEFFGIANPDAFTFEYHNLSFHSWDSKDGSQKNRLILEIDSYGDPYHVDISTASDLYNVFEDLVPFTIRIDDEMVEDRSTTRVPIVGDHVTIHEDNLTRVKAAVKIETSNGTYWRVSDAEDVFQSDQDQIALYNGVWSYPDRRAKTVMFFTEVVIDLYNPETGESSTKISYYGTKEIPLRSSRTQNFAYITASVVDLTPVMDDNGHVVTVEKYTGSTGEEVNKEVEYIPNRVQVSNTNDPFFFDASRTSLIGRGSGQKVTAFGTNTQPVSSGQFGQYPVYVFCDHSVWAMEQGQDLSVAFERISPISLSHGVNHSKRVVNSGQVIVFSYKDSIYILNGANSEPISAAVNKYPGGESIDFSNVVMGSKKRGDDNELLVSDGTSCYIYNLNYGRWYLSDKVRKSYFNFAGEVYGLSPEGKIYNEVKKESGKVPYKVVFSPMHFMAPDTLKRLYVVYLRGRIDNKTITVNVDGKTYTSNGYALRLRHKSAFDFDIEIAGEIDTEDEYLHELTLQAEQRYSHKNRVTGDG